MAPYSDRGEIKRFIIAKVEAHPADLTAITAKTFGISRQAVNYHLRGMLKDGVIREEGATRAKRYFLRPIVEKSFTIDIKPGLQEDKVWREMMEPLLKDIKENVFKICSYGFTEMFNNVLDHAEAKKVVIRFIRYPNRIELWVEDDGIGIFNKITKEFHLDDEKHAILELSKGKLTSDIEHHSGEGIFFTSRAFDIFGIFSGKLTLASHSNKDWLFDKLLDKTYINGTKIMMTINPDSEKILRDIFNKFTDEEYGFTKTCLSVNLVRYGAETLVSRSQAKRLMGRLELFKEVMLDFKDVPSIGRAFADEIFRVYQNAHPKINILYCNTTEDVEKMIKMTKAQAVRKTD